VGDGPEVALWAVAKVKLRQVGSGWTDVFIVCMMDTQRMPNGITL